MGKYFETAPKRSTKFLEEYCYVGHMTKIHEVCDHSTGKLWANDFNFLGHHRIFREESEATEVRVIFDATAMLTGYH